MTDAVKLKPCPFCGGENLDFKYEDIECWIAFVRCIECDDVLGPMSEFKYETKEEAAKDAAARWNTRAEPAPAPEAVKIEPVGYWIEHTIAEPYFLRQPSYIPAGGNYKSTPLYGPDAMDRTKELEATLGDAKEEVSSLLSSFVKEHFPENKGWKALPELAGMLSQLDNATTIARDYKARIDKLESRLVEAIKALEPFAKEADGRRSKGLKGMICFPQNHLIAARRALTGGQKDG